MVNTCHIECHNCDFSNAGPVYSRDPGPVSLTVFPSQFKIRWQFRFTRISILIQWSPQNVVHGTTTVPSWHVQKFVAIWWPVTELQQGEISMEFELRVKNRKWNGPPNWVKICLLGHQQESWWLLNENCFFRTCPGIADFLMFSLIKWRKSKWPTRRLGKPGRWVNLV